ncbi:MAG: nucleotidyltransferase family protein [Acidimicrobiales bacterium]
MDEDLEAVAAYGLATRHGLSSAPLPPAAWQSLLAEVRRQRLSGLLARAVDDCRLAVTADQRQECNRANQEAMADCLLLERLLLETVSRFAARGIDYRLMKGAALAHLAYPDPSLRAFGDVDLLVPASVFDDAVAALTNAGHARQTPELRPGFDRRFGKGATFRTTAGLEIDLHRTFVDGHFGLLVHTSDLFATSATMVLGGQNVLTLGPEEQFLAVCYNATVGGRDRPLAALRDVAQLLLDTQLDLGVVERLSREWRGEAVVALAVTRAWEVLAVAEPGPLTPWALRYRPSRADTVALTRDTAAGATWGLTALGGLSAVPGARARLTYLRALLLPASRHLRSRDMGWAQRTGRAARTLVRQVVRTLWPERR